MTIKVYLSGEIHTKWREDIINKCNDLNLDIEFLIPVLNHELSDDIGVKILGKEENKFWYDNKSAKINAIRTRTAINKADVVIVRFGKKYKQWNAAFDAGYASALNKSLIIMHEDENQHALKEVDAAANAVTKNTEEIVNILKYSITGAI
ncbi:YtoQ family protein [Pelagibacteraceae bacterium]|nr:YtoQ family protein [Pelagibacteraceae bacterium]